MDTQKDIIKVKDNLGEQIRNKTIKSLYWIQETPCMKLGASMQESDLQHGI